MNDYFTKPIQSFRNENGLYGSTVCEQPGSTIFLPSVQQGNQLYNQLQQPLKQALYPKRKREDRKSVAHIFEGQSFPFRLWHLVNNEHFDEVIYWSEDGNSVVFPCEYEFLEKVLRRTEERIFKTESMKSFIRQLNLYGFHKVQLEKDENFAYLRDSSKDKWPDAVFSHPFFKRGHPEFLDRVKRRCRVKCIKTEEKANKIIPQDMLNHYSSQLPPAAALALENNRKGNFCVQYPQFIPAATPPEHYMSQFPNILPPSYSYADQQATKRKLQFNEEKEEKRKQAVQFPAFPSPYYFYPQTYINNNFQQIIPPPGWTVAPGNPPMAQPVLAPYTEGINFIQPQLAFPRRVTPEKIEMSSDDDERPPISVSSSVPSGSSSSIQEESKINALSPLAAFCASLFRPPAYYQLDKDCVNVVDDEEN